jgi:hypothetical protein
MLEEGISLLDAINVPPPDIEGEFMHAACILLLVRE